MAQYTAVFPKSSRAARKEAAYKRYEASLLLDAVLEHKRAVKLLCFDGQCGLQRVTGRIPNGNDITFELACGHRRQAARESGEKRQARTALEQTLSRGGEAMNDRFAEAYKAYPRHIARRTAENAWRAAVRRGNDQDWMLGRVMAYAAAVDGADHQFIPYMASWLNADRFLDDPKEWTVATQPRTPPARLQSRNARNIQALFLDSLPPTEGHA